MLDQLSWTVVMSQWGRRKTAFDATGDAAAPDEPTAGLSSPGARTVTGVRLDEPDAPRQWVAPGEPIISVRGVTKSFGSHTVLDDVSFDIPKGRTTAILGPSGTGKSVLLKNILGLLTPDRGEIWVDGDQIGGMRERKLYEVRKKFGVLFQDGALFGSMSLYDNIAFPLREHTRKSEREIREIVMRNAELVGLASHLKKLPGEVSGGMKKRAGLARAMVTDPEIVLFDEPDSGLDPVRVAYLDELVNTAQRETGATFFVITHNIESVKRIAHYMGILFRSRLVKFATKEEMLASEDPVIQQFLAGKADGPIGMDEMADDTGTRPRPAASDRSSAPPASRAPSSPPAGAVPGTAPRDDGLPLIVPIPEPGRAEEPPASRAGAKGGALTTQPKTNGRSQNAESNEPNGAAPHQVSPRHPRHYVPDRWRNGAAGTSPHSS
ncbi:MAG: ATP-binding cassette domain-containing protein [Acidimicrobiales bacterium]